MINLFKDRIIILMCHIIYKSTASLARHKYKLALYQTAAQVKNYRVNSCMISPVYVTRTHILQFGLKLKRIRCWKG